MKANICKCNNCDNILIDKNPQVDAKEYDLNGTELDMFYDSSETAWVCPVCNTDDYLTDL